MIISPLSIKSVPLILKGIDLNLQSLYLNDQVVPDRLIFESQGCLEISDTPINEFKLTSTCKINPFDNNSLEGLYISEGLLTTQCEAEGFRRICYHPDRPDVLSIYTVSIEADINDYPILLSNGNKISQELVEGSINRQKVKWHDPYPKPSYLFALVAGKLNQVSSSFKTKSGKEIILNIFVEEGDQYYVNHSLDSLKRAMSWEENIYGLEYDLDEYNIVAIRHFNMGAMENKGLNIFNSKFVLADSKTATDDELTRIESIIAHEYFHNWTGNRITCRDWFQLSLKEGLTVFRDQSFTADMHSADVKRIDDVSTLINTQFKEDSGPTAHAVKPSQYFSIDNFYTTTIYEKGAELVRMLYTLLGEKYFLLGIRNYINRYDGQAVTTDDFIDAMVSKESENHRFHYFDPNQFSLWYHIVGTPKVLLKNIVVNKSGVINITLEQNYNNTSNKNAEQDLLIPVLLAFVYEDGSVSEEFLRILSKRKQEFKFTGINTGLKPTVSLFRNFSAPVKWETGLSLKDLACLYKHDNDALSKWSSGQRLMKEAIISRISNDRNLELENNLVDIFKYLISKLVLNKKELLYSLLTLPSINQLEEFQNYENIDPNKMYKCRIAFKSYLAQRLEGEMQEILDICSDQICCQWPEGIGDRKLTIMAWEFMLLINNSHAIKESLKAVKGDSMTLAKGALEAFLPIDSKEREIAMESFYEIWKGKPVVLDSWFAYEASIPRDNGLNRINKLLEDPLFDFKSPNSIRAVFSGLSNNPCIFHAKDGSGYMFMAKNILEIDKRNPITASRMIKVFSKWQSYVSVYKEKMYKAILFLNESELSTNSREIIELIMNQT